MASLLRNGLRVSKVLARAMREAATHPSKFLADAERYFSPGPQIQDLDGLPDVVPLNFVTDPALAGIPKLNVLIPHMIATALTGGPNTALNLTCRMASQGVPLRLIATNRPMMDLDHEPIWKHIASLTGIAERPVNVELCSGYDRSKPLRIGENDVFCGTGWWTVQIIKHALALTRPKKFLYIIQDFEPGFYSWSTQYALALETYHMNFRAFINEGLLAQYLCDQKMGRFAERSFIDQCTVFEPALDRQKFFPEREKSAERRHRLLFYARPAVPRNLFELGLYALRSAVTAGVFSGEEWEMLFIGEPLPDMELGDGISIRSAPWLDYEAYSELMRSSDIVLALMLSPHTSYPPLEIAACGGIAVTNTFACKTAEKLARISPNIVAVEPTPEGILSGLRDGVKRVRENERCYDEINMPQNWDSSFAQVIPKAVEMFHDCLGST